jgi:hypothetical protein
MTVAGLGVSHSPLTTRLLLYDASSHRSKTAVPPPGLLIDWDSLRTSSVCPSEAPTTRRAFCATFIPMCHQTLSRVLTSFSPRPAPMLSSQPGCPTPIQLDISLQQLRSAVLFRINFTLAVSSDIALTGRPRKFPACHPEASYPRGFET